MKLPLTVIDTLLGVLFFVAASLAQSAPEKIVVDVHAPAHPFPHFWEQTFGSGRAILALRDNYRQDLKEVHDQAGLRYVGFSAILHDEVGVYDEDEKGNPVYNFT